MRQPASHCFPTLRHSMPPDGVTSTDAETHTRPNGVETMTKTALQIIPNGAIETFNDAPLRVNGVTIRPQWAWSDSYRKHVRASMVKAHKCPDASARQYKNWLTARDRTS